MLKFRSMLPIVLTFLSEVAVASDVRTQWPPSEGDVPKNLLIQVLPTDTPELGMGFSVYEAMLRADDDPNTGHPYREVVVKAPVTTEDLTGLQYMYQYSESLEKFRQERRASASASGTFAKASGEASASAYASTERESLESYVTVRVMRPIAAERFYASPTIIVDTITEPERFIETYGDYYVDRIVRGALLTANIRVAWKNATVKQSFEASGEGEYMQAYSADATYKSALSKISKNSTIDAHVTVLGAPVAGEFQANSIAGLNKIVHDFIQDTKPQKSNREQFKAVSVDLRAIRLLPSFAQKLSSDFASAREIHSYVSHAYLGNLLTLREELREVDGKVEDALRLGSSTLTKPGDLEALQSYHGELQRMQTMWREHERSVLQKPFGKSFDATDTFMHSTRDRLRAFLNTSLMVRGRWEFDWAGQPRADGCPGHYRRLNAERFSAGFNGGTLHLSGTARHKRSGCMTVVKLQEWYRPFVDPDAEIISLKHSYVKRAVPNKIPASQDIVEFTDSEAIPGWEALSFDVSGDRLIVKGRYVSEFVVQTPLRAFPMRADVKGDRG
jgi:hypothetical protein